jgi:uncharacterized membrane protein
MTGILFRKHWTSLLGVLFILTAFVTLFKYSVDQGWITDVMKVGAGLLSGAGLTLAGIKVNARQKLPGEIITGLGIGVLYATVSFAGIYFALWEPMTVLLGMITITALVSVYAYRYESRLLMNIALAGGLLSPLMMRPETDQVFALFLYLLVINAAFIFTSLSKGWAELRVTAFVGTWLMYTVYFIHFNPVMDDVWSKPIRYAIAAFAFYMITLMIASWKNNLCFDGWNLYMSLANGVLFGLWSIVIWDGVVHYAIPLGLMGVLYMAVGFIVYRITGAAASASASHFFGGVLLLLLAATHLGKGLEVKPLVNVYLWGGIAAALALAGHWKKWTVLSLSSLCIWLVVGCYWYVVTWDTPRGEWFGTYIPFLNWGAVAWMVLAGLGFFFSMKLFFPQVKAETNDLLQNGYALLAHLIVGGLLTVQIENVFEEYTVGLSHAMELALTATWGIYAMLLFLWGGYSHQQVFRWFGSIVLVLVAIKVFFFDMAAEDTLLKVMVLMVLGGISFFITWMNSRWVTVPKKEDADEAAEV